MKGNKSLCLLLIYAVLLSFLPPPAAGQDEESEKPPNEAKGLRFRLSEGRGAGVKTPPAALPAAAGLGAAETDAILRRLPPMAAESADAVDFSKRASSLPPPKTGRVIPVKFPAADFQPAPDRENSAALEIVRASPTGAVALVTDLSVTFSQPMIAVSSQSRAAETVPVRLAPAVKGRWRWLGTKTLIFDADERFPAATRFTVTIPAGTKSAAGGVLPKEAAWDFQTPPPKVESFVQSGATVRREALLVAEFNQRIEPAAVLPLITATAGGQTISLRLAAPAEIAADKPVADAVKNFSPGRWMAFRAAELLPADSRIELAFAPGVPSAEGALTSPVGQSFGFKTFGKMKFAGSSCGYGDANDPCADYEDFRIKFSNPIDAQSFDKSLVRVEPPIDYPEISVDGDELRIDGLKKTRATYRVTISGALRDEFGQTLGGDVSAEFRTAADSPSLTAEKGDGELVTLDPAGRRRFSVFSRNHRKLTVKIFAVKPEDYGVFVAYSRSERKVPPTIGRIVYVKTLTIKAKPDTSVETKIDLDPALTNGLGHAVLFVEPEIEPGRDEYENVVVWLEATQLGLDAFADYEQLTVYASRLRDGTPLKDVALTFSNAPSASAQTDETGLARLATPANAENAAWLIARRGVDTAILPNKNNYSYYSNRNWFTDYEPESLRWFVFDDRQMYRPGETVSIKGYLRRIAAGKLADVGELGDAVKTLGYVLRDPLGNEIAKGRAELNVFGAFDLRLDLPETVNLGYQRLELSADGGLPNKKFEHRFQVQEFRRPEFEVTVKPDSPAPYFVGRAGKVGVEAKYYAGGGLGGAETDWKVTAAPVDYAPPNREEFTFGKFVPWWRGDADGDSENETTENFKAATDSEGRHFLALDFLSADPARPYSVTAEARVRDVNRQTFAGSTTLLVHPAELYVGLRTPKAFVDKGDSFRIEAIATDIDGRAKAGAPVAVVAELKDWEQVKGEWREITVDTQTCRLTSEPEPLACDFKAARGGRFLITATVLDQSGRRSESELEVWVAGGRREPVRDVERETIELIPDRKEYAPGETAQILVNAPFFPAEGVLTLRRNGVVRTERFTMTDASTVLKIPLEERFLPNVYAQVDLFGAAGRIVFEDERDAKLPKRPAFASGALNLPVSTASRELNVAAEPVQKTLEPGGATSIDVAVTDRAGNPTPAAEVAVVAVDESILALTNYRIANPLDVFYREIAAGTTDYNSRESILLAAPEDLITTEKMLGFGNGSGMGSGSGGGSGDGDGLVSKGVKDFLYSPRAATKGKKEEITDPNQIRLRKNFDALAIFSPSVRTGADGKAIVKIDLPDNLTRYRITAVAVAGGKKFGRSEATLTARQALMVRPSAPRFMNFGDRAELPVVVQNQTAAALTVDVAVRAANARLTDGGGRRLTVPANDRVELRFPVEIERAGLARFQVGAVSGRLADAAEFAFPVYTPATSEAFATYGTTDQNGAIVQPILTPGDVFPEFGGLEVTTSSTQLQELTDAFIYLQNYPFECSEQISSRILATAALRDVLQAFDAKDLPTKEQIEAKMTADIERLGKLQHADGGFNFWSNRGASLPYVSVHVAHALARANAKGYRVAPEVSAKVTNYLRAIEEKYPPFYSPATRFAISAYALYVRDLMGENYAEKARAIRRQAGAENLSPETLGWLLSVLAGDRDSAADVAALERDLLNRVTETANAAHFVTDYKDGRFVLLSSDRRADGVVLEALIKAADRGPAGEKTAVADLIPKIVRGLLANKTQGRWLSTQENAFVLLALDRYFQAFEKTTPDFVARVWLGNFYAGEQKFAGRSVDSQSLGVPMRVLRETTGTQDLILDRQGAGRLYYRIGLKYAPKNLNLEAADDGFAVFRTYEAVDDPADVGQTADGRWRFRSGARVRVRLTMVAPARRYHVALVDNLPAGLEIVNPDLAVSESLPVDAKTRIDGEGFFDPVWYDHQNLRDERAEAFTALLTEGVWNYSYVARATTPGSFVAAPAKAEEMYSPETFGRSRTDFVEIR